MPAQIKLTQQARRHFDQLGCGRAARIHYTVRRIGRKRSEAAIIVALLREYQEAPAEALSSATVVRGPFETAV